MKSLMTYKGKIMQLGNQKMRKFYCGWEKDVISYSFNFDQEKVLLIPEELFCNLNLL
jgi:hypothetical protein